MRASIQLIPESIQLTCLSCISERILTVDDGGSKSHEDPPIENGNKHFKKKKKKKKKKLLNCIEMLVMKRTS